MNRKGLYALHRKMCGDARFLLSVKNQDRATSADPFVNLRHDGLLGIVTRMQDKVSRLRTYAQGRKLKDKDKLFDDLLDLMNYANLFAGLDIDTQEKKNEHRLRSDSIDSAGSEEGREEPRSVSGTDAKSNPPDS